MRKELKDVQLHPVKMLIFVKFKNQLTRDEVAAKLQGGGVFWSAYNKLVKGYSLDKEVKFIRILGVSPETSEEDVRVTIEEKLGEVMEIKRGMLDERRLPGVTNGMWTVKVKILDPDKELPSYIHRQDEGEIWSLNFEGRRFVCWKCGSPSHIGDKCREPGRTFEETFPEEEEVRDGSAITWAAVVRNKGALASARKDLEKKIAEKNREKDIARIENEQRKVDEEQLERERLANEARERELARVEAENNARLLMEESERKRLEKERHEEFIRSQNQLAEDNRVGFPGAFGLSQSLSDDDLLAALSLTNKNDGLDNDDQENSEKQASNSKEVVEVNGMDGVNEDGVENGDSYSESSTEGEFKEGEQVNSNDHEMSFVSDDIVDEEEDEQHVFLPHETSTPESGKVGVILNSVTGEVEEALTGNSIDVMNFSDGPNSSDFPLLRNLFK